MGCRRLGDVDVEEGTAANPHHRREQGHQGAEAAAGQVVADFGAGSGYYAIRMAKAWARRGRSTPPTYSRGCWNCCSATSPAPSSTTSCRCSAPLTTRSCRRLPEVHKMSVAEVKTELEPEGYQPPSCCELFPFVVSA